MGPRSVKLKLLGYFFFLGHRTREKWGMGVGALLGPVNVHGRSANDARQEARVWHPPGPEKAKEQLIEYCSEGSSFLCTLRTFSHASRLLSPSVAVVGSSSAAGSVLQHGVLLQRHTVVYLSRRSFQLGCHSHFGASETVQKMESNVKNEPDLLAHTVKEAAISALKKHLVDVKGAPDEDAEFISRNCPMFTQKMVAFVTMHVLEKKDSESLQSYMRNFIENKDKEALNELPRFTAVDEVSGRPTLGNMLQMAKFPLTLTGHGGLLKCMAILDSLGWSRYELWEILERNPELLTWTAEDLQANICILQKVGVKKRDMLSFIEDSSVFTSDLEERLAPLLQYLKVIGIEWNVLGDLLKFNPQGLIKMPLANFRERVDFLLELGLSSSEVEKSMRVFPQLVHLRLANLTQKIEYFDGIGVDRDSMVKIIAKLPSIFRHSIERNLVPKVQLLASIGVVKSHLAKFVAQYPQFFGCSIENLQKKVAFFETNGLTGERLVKMITWHPRVFSFSVDENLPKKVQFLVSKGFVIRSIPMVRALASCITISTDSLEARLQNLQSLGFTHKVVCELVNKQPTIFCLSEKTIRGKIDYLVNTMNRSQTELLKCPGYLLYSLELRIKPRHRVVALLTSKGVIREDAYSLSTILQPSEKVFMQKFVNLDPECSNVYLDVVDKPDSEQAGRVAQLASLGLALKGGTRRAPALTSSIQDLSVSQKAAVAII